MKQPTTPEVRGVQATTSPSMDIQVSSNFERLLFDAYRRDAGAVRNLMNSLAQSKRFSVSAPALEAMRELFAAGRADGQETAATIRAWMREASYCADPHTAVALAVAEKEPRDPKVPMVVLSTAHPAKFPQTVVAATGEAPALPPRFKDLYLLPERCEAVPADAAAVRDLILKNVRNS